MKKEKKPDAEETRGRRFAKAMENRHAWPDLTGRQLEQVLGMAEEFHAVMRRARSERTSNP